MDTKEPNPLVPFVWFGLICWLALSYYQPYALLLPLVLGAIAEAVWPHALRPKKPIDKQP